MFLLIVGALRGHCKNKVQYHSMYGTIKIPPCSKVMSAVQRKA